VTSGVGVIFDFDGVIVDSEEFWFRAYSKVLADFGVSVTREVYAREWVSLGRGPEYACATFPAITISPDEMRRRRAPIVRDLLLAEAGLMPHAAEAIPRLAAEFPLVVATNSHAEVVHPLLEKFGLRTHFADVVTKECYARPKPAPDAFLAAAAALGLPPARCVVLEDAEKGVVAARAAGSPCVAIPNEWTRGNDFSTAGRVVGSLAEVTQELVRSLGGR
jgi:HAD superfamily hydrolase (TIGR01509 family)